MKESGRFIEFFEVNNSLAMRNLTIFITILIASVIVLVMTFLETITGEIFSAYLLAGGSVYSFGKWQDEKTCRETGGKDAISDNSDVAKE